MTYTAARAAAAVKVAASLGVRCDDPVILADGAKLDHFRGEPPAEFLRIDEYAGRRPAGELLAGELPAGAAGLVRTDAPDEAGRDANISLVNPSSIITDHQFDTSQFIREDSGSRESFGHYGAPKSPRSLNPPRSFPGDRTMGLLWHQSAQEAPATAKLSSRTPQACSMMGSRQPAASG